MSTAAVDTPQSLSSRLLTRRTISSFAIAVLVLGLAIWRANLPWAETFTKIRHADIRLYLAAVVVFYSGFLVRGWRWRVLLGNTGERCGVLALSEIIVVSFFVNCIVPAKMGDIYRAVLVRQRQRVPASKALGTIIAERLIDLLALMTLLVIAGAAVIHKRKVLGSLVPYLVIGGIISCAGIAVIVVMRLGRGQRLLRLFPARIAERYESFRLGAVQSFGRWGLVLPQSVAVWAIEASRLGLVVFALGAGNLLSPSQFLLVALIAALLTTVPFTPGGVGLVELGMVTVVTLVADVPKDVAVSIALLDRSISYVSLVLVGFIVSAVGHVRVEQGRVTRTSVA